MNSHRVSVWLDRDGDMLEVLWAFREGFFAPTEDDRVLKRLDDNGEVIGFLVHDFSTFNQLSPVEFTLEEEPLDDDAVNITASGAALELGISNRRVRQLAEQGRVQGAAKVGHEWLIPTPVQVIYGQRGPMGAAQRIAETQASYRPARSSSVSSKPSSPAPQKGKRRSKTPPGDAR